MMDQKTALDEYSSILEERMLAEGDWELTYDFMKWLIRDVKRSLLTGTHARVWNPDWENE